LEVGRFKNIPKETFFLVAVIWI